MITFLPPQRVAHDGDVADHAPAGESANTGCTATMFAKAETTGNIIVKASECWQLVN